MREQQDSWALVYQAACLTRSSVSQLIGVLDGEESCCYEQLDVPAEECGQGGGRVAMFTTLFCASE